MESRSVEDHLELGGRYIEHMDTGWLSEARMATACRLVLSWMRLLGMDEWVSIETPPLGAVVEGEAGRQVWEY